MSAKRAAAFAKRLLQCALPGPPHFACGALLLVSEVLKAQPALWAGMLQPEDNTAAAPALPHALAPTDEGEAEAFRDLDEPEEESGQAGGGTAQPQPSHTQGAGAEAGRPAWPKPGYYDMHKR